MADNETKPEESSANPEHINLKVMGQDGNVVQFKIKKQTAFRKLMSTYCERAGLSMPTVRFTFDGTRIGEGDNPKELGLEDGDTIEVFQQQSGGGDSAVQHGTGGRN
jgi:small ubiquitin-related modifier